MQEDDLSLSKRRLSGGMVCIEDCPNLKVSASLQMLSDCDVYALSLQQSAEENMAMMRPKSAGPGGRGRLSETASSRGSSGNSGDSKAAATSDVLRRTHAELMSMILEEEDALMSFHRRQIEETMATVKQEMAILAEAEKPGGTIEEYAGKLTSLLEKRAKSIADLQGRLTSFERHLREEEMVTNRLHKPKK